MSLLLSNNYTNKLSHIQLENLDKNITQLKSKLDNSKFQNIIKEKQKLYNTCKEMESILVKQMLTAMKKNINKSGLIDGGFAEEVFEDMLFNQYALSMSHNTKFGIAEAMYKQLSNIVQ